MFYLNSGLSMKSRRDVSYCRVAMLASWSFYEYDMSLGNISYVHMLFHLLDWSYFWTRQILFSTFSSNLITTFNYLHWNKVFNPLIF
jgi:hypothetical protein